MNKQFIPRYKKMTAKKAAMINWKDEDGIADSQAKAKKRAITKSLN
jgi:hypothetical protein